jgi:hypothetical protein
MEEESHTSTVPAPAVVNPAAMNVGDKILILGQSQSGKTTLIERLIRNNHHKFNVIWAFCGTVAVSRNYLWNEPFIIQLDAPVQLGEDSHITQIKKIVRLQQVVAEKCREKGEDIPPMLLVFDDCLSMNFYTDSIFWGGWMSSLRHYAISVIFSVQTLHEVIPPSVRSQMDKVFLFPSRADPQVVMQTIPPLHYKGGTYTGRAAYDIISNLLAVKYQCLLFDSLNGVHGHVFTADPAKPFVMSYGARAGVSHM